MVILQNRLHVFCFRIHEISGLAKKEEKLHNLMVGGNIFLLLVNCLIYKQVLVKGGKGWFIPPD